MKKTSIYPVLALLACACACGKVAEEDFAAGMEPLALRAVVTEGASTRGVATGTALPSSATMYLSADHNGTGATGNYFSNVAFTASSTTWNPASGNYYWPLSGNLEFLAFCNYGPTNFASTATRTNATAISVSSSDWTADDMMFGAATSAPANGKTLTFRHALSQVKFTAKLESASTVNLKGITINAIKGASLSCTKSAGSASLTVSSSTSGYSATDVTGFFGTQALSTTATAVGTPVLLPDQTISSITVSYVSVSGGVEGPVNSVTKSVSRAITKGNAYTFAITITKEGILFDILVNPWGGNAIAIGEFPLEDPPLSIAGLMIAPAPLHYSSANGFEIIDDDWNHFSSLYGKVDGSYDFCYEEVGQYFDSRGTSFEAFANTDFDGNYPIIDNNGNRVSYGGYDDWRMLTTDDYLKIFGTRTGATINGVSGCKWVIVDVQDVNNDGKWGTMIGLLLAPDDLVLDSMSASYAWQQYSNNSSNLTNTTVVNEYVDAGCAFIPGFGWKSSTGSQIDIDDVAYFALTSSFSSTSWYVVNIQYNRYFIDYIPKSYYIPIRLVRDVY